MKIKTIKEMAQKYTKEELYNFADEFERTGLPPVMTNEDPGEQMSDYLIGAEIRKLLDQGLTINEAIREFSKRIREVLN